MKTRRLQFLKWTAVVVIGVALPLMFGLWDAHAFYQSPKIPLFGTNLRGIGTIGVAAPDPTPAPVTGVTHYTLTIDQFSDNGVAPTVGPTTLRGYSPTRLLAGQKKRHLGGILVGKGRAPGLAGDKAVPIQLTFRNNLPAGKHIIPNDQTILGANQGNDRTAIHFHGGLVPWISDGGPFDWWNSTVQGMSFLNNKVLNPGAAANEAEYYYPLNQSARFGWYHDHAFGITRINAYSGQASALLIRDGFEDSLIKTRGLPDYIERGGREIPLVIQDKIFVGSNIKQLDPTWSSLVAPAATTPGSLWYAHIYERNRFRSGGFTRSNTPNSSIIPEFFGDTMLVNGTVYPKVTVEARRYRLRILNACNARFLNLQLYVADGSLNGITLDPLGNPTNAAAGCDPNTPGQPSVLQIGTEGGFLPSPARIPTNVPFNTVDYSASLMVSPAERPDIIVDFKNYAGQSIVLYNDAPAPFPGGDPRNDYFPGYTAAGNPVNATTPAGYGPNSRVLMRFDVVPVPANSVPDTALAINTTTNLTAGNEPFLNPASVTLPVRQLSLNESFDAYGRLQQLLGTTVPMAYLDTPTENVAAGSTEIWEVTNNTADVHPIHIHLTNFQLLGRVSIGGVFPNGATGGIGANETGWKETVSMYPGTVTQLIMKFDLAPITGPAPNYTPIDFSAINNGGNPPYFGYGGLGTPPPSPRTGGNEYVWHCHILEHEEHDMMRPLVVAGP